MASAGIDVVEIVTVHDDLSRGLVSGLSDVGLGSSRRKSPVRWCRLCDNLIFRPRRAASVRGGSLETSTAVLDEKPTSLGKFYASAGNSLYVATDDGAGGGKIFRRTALTNVQQSLPFTPTDLAWRFEMFNGILIGCQRGGTQKPIFYATGNPADTWHSMTLPAPASAPTFGADQAGGSLTAGVAYFWRVRWRYSNGSSLASPVSAGHTLTGPNLTARVNIPLPGSPRSDYIGWTLERSKANGSSAGPFYTVNDGTASTYDDGAADAGLFTRTSEVIHGEPPHFEGVIGHKGRLFGWTGSLLYASQPITGDEATGICNWQGDLIYPVQKDDGDSIVAVAVQGDRLTIFKRASIHVLEGDDPDDFRLRRLYQGTGAAGPRAVASTGLTLWFYSGAGLFNVLDGDRLLPIGDDELRYYAARMDRARDDDVVAANLTGEYVIFGYANENDADPQDQVLFDLRQRVWTHFVGWRMADMLVQKDRTDFGGAPLLFADPKLTTAGGTVVPFGHQALPSGAEGYHVWIGFQGNADQRDVGGSGGLQIAFAAEGPQMDDGFPDGDKDYDWVEAYINSGQADIVATVILDDGGSVAVPLSASTSQPRYDSGVLFDDGAFYAHEGRTVVVSGLPKGTIARSRAVRLSGATTEPIELGGYAIRGYLLPSVEFS